MRENKYRAWDKTRNMYGQVLGINWPCGDHDEKFPDGRKGRLDLFNPENESDCGFWGIWIEKADIEQFTGLHDKNGREIYEGDIIKTDYEDSICQRGLVEFDIENGAFCVKNERGLWQRFGVTIFTEDYEVIGNIHETRDISKAVNAVDPDK